MGVGVGAGAGFCISGGKGEEESAYISNLSCTLVAYVIIPLLYL